MISIRSIVVGFLVAVGLSVSASGQSAPKFHRLQGGLIHGVFFLDSQRGWTAEDGGVIRSTIDGGFTWNAVAIQDAETNEAIRIPLQGILVQQGPNGPTDVRGWAVGDNGVVLKTVPLSSGQTWQDGNPTSRVADSRDEPLPCGQNLSKLYQIWMKSDGLTGWVVGLDGALRKTLDGGATWFNPFTVLTDLFPCSPDPGDLYDVHFFADSTPGAPYSKGVVASEYGKVYTTTDSGATWVEVSVKQEVSPLCPIITDHNLEFWSIDFDSPQIATSPGWLVGGVGNNNGYIFRTSNGGVSGSWSQTKCYDFLNPGGQAGICGLSTLYAVAALNSSDPMAVTCGYGAGMFDRRAGTADFDPCICATGNPCGAGTPTWVQRNVSLMPPEPCNSQPPIFGAARISSTEACMVGSFGRILRYASGAATDVGTTSFTRLYDGKFIDGSKGCVTGQGYLIKRTTDGGVTWADVSNWACDTTSQGNAIDFTSFTAVGGLHYGVMVGTGGFIAWSSNDGQTWTKVTSSPTSADLNDVAWANTVGTGCAALGRAVAVASTGAVLASDDFGHTWSMLPTPGGLSPDALYGVSFASTCTGYACGASQKVYQTTDGGQSWSAVPVVGGAGETFYDVQTWGNGTSAIMVGQNGAVFEKTSTRFQKQTLGGMTVADHLLDVEVLSNGAIVRIGGDNGVALFRDNGTWTKHRSDAGGPLYRMSFQAADQGFSIGRNFVIVKYAP